VDIEYLLDPWIKIPLGGRNHVNKILQKKLSQMTQTKPNKQILEMMIGLPKANF
jgi:hypothetical protein